jgi:membrane protease subunit (stomatin/prohibitin family)
MAAANEAGAATGFVGMGMAMNAGGANPAQLFAMGQHQPQQTVGGWQCSCGQVNQGNFCQNCGSKKPGARCEKCGWSTDGPAPKFCPNCGDKF